MTREKRLYQEFEAATRPTDAQAARVMERLRDRQRRQELGLTQAGRAPLGRRWLLATALAVAVLGAFLAWPQVRWLTARLDSTDHFTDLAPTSEVSLSFQGQGELSGTDRDPVVTWERGTLVVEVEPGRHIPLVVETREGRVRVTGTGFTVDRDAMGTHVVVRHGSVDVECHSAGRSALGPGQDVLCPPVSAAGWLARSRLQQDQGQGPQVVLESSEAGLALCSPTDLARYELGAIRVRALADLGRRDEALAAAERYLEDPQATRADEVRRLAARLALQEEASPCQRAQDHLRALAPTDPEAAAILETCQRGGR